MTMNDAPVDPFASLRTSSPSSLSAAFAIRLGLCSFSALLALAGLWLLFPVLLHPSSIGLPLDRNSAAAAATSQVSARKAAEIGAIRGSLWVDAAFADALLLWQDRGTAPDRSGIERTARARSAMETGLALAPVNAEGWLFLAALPAPTAGTDGKVASLLELSYLTGPNNLSVAPLRIERAVTSGALADRTIQDFVKTDIHKILTYRPQLKSAIVGAYRNASPQNRPIFDALVADVDPGFAQSLRAGAAR